MCKRCEQPHYILAHPVDVDKWLEGASVQDALPYLKPDDREMLISNICPMCWVELFEKPYEANYFIGYNEEE
jgi:hypothetical protein